GCGGGELPFGAAPGAPGVLGRVAAALGAARAGARGGCRCPARRRPRHGARAARAPLRRRATDRLRPEAPARRARRPGLKRFASSPGAAPRSLAQRTMILLQQPVRQYSSEAQPELSPGVHGVTPSGHCPEPALPPVPGPPAAPLPAAPPPPPPAPPAPPVPGGSQLGSGALPRQYSHSPQGLTQAATFVQRGQACSSSVFSAGQVGKSSPPWPTPSTKTVQQQKQSQPFGVKVPQESRHFWLCVSGQFLKF